jgi:AcrR family transcriptional regulator
MKRRPLRYALQRTGGPSAWQSGPTDGTTHPVNPPPSAKPTRKDALSNRERILTVARDALAASSSASLTAIAKQAGVGIGTLYRHFPTREALVLELYRHDIQHLIDRAPELLRERPPLDALRRWFDEVAHYGRLKYGVAEVIHAATNGGLDDEYYAPFVRAIALLLDAGAADGSLKPGLDPEDVLLQLSVLWRIDPARGGEERAERILALVVDGLRAAPTA